MFFFKRKKLIEINEKIEKVMQAIENQSRDFHNIEQHFNMLGQEVEKNAESINHILETMMNLNMDSKQYICSYIDEKSGKISSDDENRFINIKNILQEQEKNRTILSGGIADEIKKFWGSYNDNEKEMRKSIDSIKEFLHNIGRRFDMLGQEVQKNAENIDHIPETMMNLNMDSKQYICSYIDEKSGQMSSDDENRFVNIKNILQEQEKNRAISAEGIADEIKKIRDSYKDSEKEMWESINSMKELMDVNMEMENSEDGKLDAIENEIRLLLLNSVMEQIPQ